MKKNEKKAISEITEKRPDLKIAVVDINKIIEQSSKVIEIKKQVQLNNVALQNWLSSVNQLLDNTHDDIRKSILRKHYDTEYAQKQAIINAEYNKSISEVEKEIIALVEKKAKDEKYDFVFSKASVIFGGTDISDSIAKIIERDNSV